MAWHNITKLNTYAPMDNDFIRRMYCPDTEKHYSKLNKLCIFKYDKNQLKETEQTGQQWLTVS